MIRLNRRSLSRVATVVAIYDAEQLTVVVQDLLMV